MKKKRLLYGVTAATVLLGGAALSTQDKPVKAATAPTQTAPEVPVAEVVVRQIAPTIESTATLAAVQSVEVRARVSGFVESVGFEEGGLVRAGQVLYQLDARPFRASVAQARAELARAEEQEALAKLKLSRGDKLVPDGVISPSAHDALVAEAGQARAAVAAARAAVLSAELELGYTRVVSPIAGRIGRALVKAGNLVSGGTDHATLLTTIVTVDPIHVEFDVDEPTFRRLSQERRAAARERAGATVSLALADETGFPHAAKLDFLANVLDASTGTARARAVLENDDERFAPGLFGRVRVATGAPRDTTLVSDKAIHTDQQGRYVLVVSAQGVIEQRHVETGPAVEGLRVVRAGLAHGDKVVLSSMVRPGMQVKPRLVAMLTSSTTLADGRTL